MSRYSVGDRVRCVDATPRPMHVAVSLESDFRFPGGFLVEGAVYCVKGVYADVGGHPSITLVGHPVVYKGREIPWCGARFRKLTSADGGIRRLKKTRSLEKLLNAVSP